MDENKVKGWLAQMCGGNVSCRICGHDQHQVFPMLQAALSLDPNTKGQGQTVPMVQVMCQRCGHMQFFAAAKVPT